MMRFPKPKTSNLQGWFVAQIQSQKPVGQCVKHCKSSPAKANQPLVMIAQSPTPKSGKAHQRQRRSAVEGQRIRAQ